jgi:hypothetical protein
VKTEHGTHLTQVTVQRVAGALGKSASRHLATHPGQVCEQREHAGKCLFLWLTWSLLLDVTGDLRLGKEQNQCGSQFWAGRPRSMALSSGEGVTWETSSAACYEPRMASPSSA